MAHRHNAHKSAAGAPLPPPAATLARVAGTVRLAAAADRAPLHVLAAEVTRCGHRPATSWTVYGPGARVPARRLCRTCSVGLPPDTRAKLIPTPAELGAVHELTAREAAQALTDTLDRLRTAALVDGSAYEPTVLVEARLAQAAPAGMRRVDRAQLVTGYVATGRELSLLELLNTLDPIRPDVPHQRMYVLDPPAPGDPVDVSSYDARAYDWRRRGHAL